MYGMRNVSHKEVSIVPKKDFRVNQPPDYLIRSFLENDLRTVIGQIGFFALARSLRRENNSAGRESH